MKIELIRELFQKFEEAAAYVEGVECWSARELQAIFSYRDWRNFVKVIEKAKAACEGAGCIIKDHFVELNEMIVIGKGGQRDVENYALTNKSDMVAKYHYIRQKSLL